MTSTTAHSQPDAVISHDRRVQHSIVSFKWPAQLSLSSSNNNIEAHVSCTSIMSADLVFGFPVPFVFPAPGSDLAVAVTSALTSTAPKSVTQLSPLPQYWPSFRISMIVVVYRFQGECAPFRSFPISHATLASVGRRTIALLSRSLLNLFPISVPSFDGLAAYH